MCHFAGVKLALCVYIHIGVCHGLLKNFYSKELHENGEPSSSSDYRNKSSVHECLCNISVSIGYCHACVCVFVYLLIYVCISLGM